MALLKLVFLEGQIPFVQGETTLQRITMSSLSSLGMSRPCFSFLLIIFTYFTYILILPSIILWFEIIFDKI